jgi:hypothetical protein
MPSSAASGVFGVLRERGHGEKGLQPPADCLGKKKMPGTKDTDFSFKSCLAKGLTTDSLPRQREGDDDPQTAEAIPWLMLPCRLLAAKSANSANVSRTHRPCP